MMPSPDGFRRCECETRRARQSFFDRIPVEFGVPRLDHVKPDPGRHPKQAQAIEAIRTSPNESYFIFGANGAGKTFLSWALCVHAFEAGRKVVVNDLDRLLKDWRKYEFGRRGEEPDYIWRPSLLAEDLQQGGRKYTVFLDEIGATSPTEYAAKEFFHLLKAAHEFEHQIITTCNVSPRELQEHWSRQDSFWGNSIARRLAEYSTQVNLL
jgi:DNA replication protein DnaC